MTNRRTYFAVLSATAAAFWAGSSFNSRPAAAANGHGAGRKILYYADPMHPAYRSDKPGIAPDCGMQLEAVYAGAEPAAPATPAGAIPLTAQGQLLGGVRVGEVERGPIQHPLRLLGRVAADEARIYRLNAGIEGFIQDVSPVTTGSQVARNQLLATFSAPNAIMAIQTFLLNLGGEDRFKQRAAEGSVEAQSLAAAAANIQQRLQQLQNLGMPLLQIEEIRRTRTIPDTIRILSPVDGIVLARNVSPGQKFDRGVEWYRIADLSRVWILADVFPGDAQYLRPGQAARLSIPGDGAVFTARVSEVRPQFDGATRTLKVRLEADNPGDRLRPDMFADVELSLASPSLLTVPADAVLDSGLAQTVFVDRGDGSYEPRAVATGRRFSDRVEILRGLTPGERIATSGSFLLDSESRMRRAAPEPESDPVCGMRIASRQHASEYGGRQHYFCSEHCKRTFDKSPEQYLNLARKRQS